MQHHDPHHNRDESVRGGNAPTMVTKIEVTANALSVAAIFLCGLLLGVLLMVFPYSAARIEAGKAQAEATAREARSTAKVTEDKLYELRDALNAKGHNLPKLDGH